MTKSGKFVGQFNVDPAPGGAFGIGISMVGGGDTARLAVVDDNTNNLMVFNQSVQNAQ